MLVAGPERQRRGSCVALDESEEAEEAVPSIHRFLGRCRCIKPLPGDPCGGGVWRTLAAGQARAYVSATASASLRDGSERRRRGGGGAGAKAKPGPERVEQDRPPWTG